MTKKLEAEIKKIIKKYEMDYTVKQFEINIQDILMHFVSLENEKLSAQFLTYFSDEFYHCHWQLICMHQKLSINFMEKFSHKLDWYCISENQILSEKFIHKHRNKVIWEKISRYQLLSEKFIEKYSDYIHFDYIGERQQLSESFILKFQDRLNFRNIQYLQPLSNKLLCNIKACKFYNYEWIHQKKTLAQKKQEIQQYATKHNLVFDGKYLYAYRNHDIFGRGTYNRTIFYNEIGKEYRDWHCNMDPYYKSSFGLGIWPSGNTKVKIAVKDWGTEVDENGNGKARVFAFTIFDANEFLGLTNKK